MTEHFKYIGFWKRVLAALIDGILGWLLMPLSFWLTGLCYVHRSIVPNMAFALAWHVLFLFFVVRLGATPGKLCIRARIVDLSGQYLSIGKALLRIAPNLIFSIPSFVMLYAAVSEGPIFEIAPNLKERTQLMMEHGGIALTLARMGSWFVLVDVLVVAFNRKKRAIHDFIAGSYVVSKASLDALAIEVKNGDVEEEK